MYIINSKEIKENWDESKSVRKNQEEMGLCYDANEALKIPSRKKEKIDQIKTSITGGFVVRTILYLILFFLIKLILMQVSDVDPNSNIPSKSHVAHLLEEQANAPRERRFR